MNIDRGVDGHWHHDPRPDRDFAVKHFGWFFSNPFAYLAIGLIGQLIVLLLILWKLW